VRRQGRVSKAEGAERTGEAGQGKGG